MKLALSIYLAIVHAMLTQVAGLTDMPGIGDAASLYVVSNAADGKPDDLSEYVLKRLANNINIQDAQDAPVDRLVTHLNQNLTRLVDGAADELGKPSSEVYEGVRALIRARGGGGRGPRHHFNPRDFLDSIYNEESRKFVDRMYELFKQLVSAYVKSVSESGLDESPHTSITTSSRPYPALMASTSEASPAKENDDTTSGPSATTGQKKPHTTSSKSANKTRSKSQSDRDEDDDGEDEGGDDDDNADTDDEGDDKNNGKDRQRAENSDQATSSSSSSTTPVLVPTESSPTSATPTTTDSAATTVTEATATSL